ncbi:hypothetical protein GCM10027066_24880 [Dyella jejuensis]
MHTLSAISSVGCGTIVDASIISAPSSTKNQSGQRDPEMHQTAKGKQWYFGMKAHIGMNSKEKIIHTVKVSAANVAADWIKTKPGTRPAMWWRYDAPRLDPAQLGRWSRTVLAPRLIETRRKLSGEGMPLHEALNYAPSHHYGIPAWFGDPDNPPAFESQRAYLKRHSLPLPAERRQVPEPVRYPLRIEVATRWK